MSKLRWKMYVPPPSAQRKINDLAADLMSTCDFALRVAPPPNYAYSAVIRASPTDPNVRSFVYDARFIAHEGTEGGQAIDGAMAGFFKHFAALVPSRQKRKLTGLWVLRIPSTGGLLFEMDVDGGAPWLEDEVLHAGDRELLRESEIQHRARFHLRLSHPRFNDELANDLARCVLFDSAFADADWSIVGAIVGLEPEVVSEGFRHDAGGLQRATMGYQSELRDAAGAAAAVVLRHFGQSPRTILICVFRSQRLAKIAFKFDTVARWPSLDDVQRGIEELKRPDWGE